MPSETAMEWIVRSATIESLQPLQAACVRPVSRRGDRLRLHDRPRLGRRTRYADMIDNGPMVRPTSHNAARLGRTVVDPATSVARVVGSTDMGNISYLVPSIHPMIKVAADGVPIHTRRLRRVGASRRRRPGGARRRQGDGDDRRRPVDVGRPPPGHARRRSPIDRRPSRCSVSAGQACRAIPAGRATPPVGFAIS